MGYFYHRAGSIPPDIVICNFLVSGNLALFPGKRNTVLRFRIKNTVNLIHKNIQAAVILQPKPHHNRSVAFD